MVYLDSLFDGFSNSCHVGAIGVLELNIMVCIELSLFGGLKVYVVDSSPLNTM